MDTKRFRDRRDAGVELAGSLSALEGAPDTVVYGLARGGVPVAAVVADRLGLPLDVIVVRKVGAPSNPELAVGAITTVGGMVVNDRVMAATGVSREQLDELAKSERSELESQESSIRGGADRIPPDGKTALLVDDGLATGASMEAAVRAMKESGATKVIAAVPVASVDAERRVGEVADRVECLMTPTGFSAVGQWYDSFGQTSTDAVREILEGSRGG
ncbi:MAG: phosphoribosyltransferase [Spirochaetota bacterium]